MKNKEGPVSRRRPWNPVPACNQGDPEANAAYPEPAYIQYKVDEPRDAKIEQMIADTLSHAVILDGARYYYGSKVGYIQAEIVVALSRANTVGEMPDTIKIKVKN